MREEEGREGGREYREGGIENKSSRGRSFTEESNLSHWGEVSTE